MQEGKTLRRTAIQSIYKNGGKEIEVEKLEVVTREQGGKRISIVQVQGDVDIKGSDQLLKELMELEDWGNYHILVDLGKVEFICSSALGVLISTLQSLTKHNGTLKLLHLQNGVREKFKITKLIREFEVYESEEEALRSFNLKQ